MNWLEALEGQQAKSRPSNRVQIATVDDDGKPALRTVVLRGFLGQKPWFFTDARSAKVAHLKARPAISILLWLEKTSDQFRLDGLATSSGSDSVGELAALRQSTWARLKEAQRLPFIGPDPGTPLKTPAARLPLPGAVPDSLLIVTVEVDHVDWLTLGDPHRRSCFTRTELVWSHQALVP